jgi:hypothetical protein
MSMMSIYLLMHKFKNMSHWMYYVSSELYVYENHKI